MLPRITALAALFVLGLASPSPAQTLTELTLCPPTIQRTCFIGYVTAPNKVVVIISSVDNDPLAGKEVEVVATSLSKEVGSVVMLDATAGAGTLTNPTLVSVADPLLTALYLSSFLTSTMSTPQ